MFRTRRTSTSEHAIIKSCIVETLESFHVIPNENQHPSLDIRSIHLLLVLTLYL